VGGGIYKKFLKLNLCIF